MTLGPDELNAVAKILLAAAALVTAIRKRPRRGGSK